MKNHIYFASDFHLGLDWIETSRDRETRIVQWLRDISPQMKELHLVGDIFDFWFEYKRAIPKGFTRILGQLAEMCDQGLDLHVYTGNHDMWMGSYLEDELGATIHRKPQIIERNGKRLYIHHGDKSRVEDRSFKLLRRIFDSKLCQWLFRRVHPDWGLWIGQRWSVMSRNRHPDIQPFNESTEYLIKECEALLLEHNQIDYFIFGHRHLPIDYTLSNNNSRYINLGDWFYHKYGYAFFDGENLLAKSESW